MGWLRRRDIPNCVDIGYQKGRRAVRVSPQSDSARSDCEFASPESHLSRLFQNHASTRQRSESELGQHSLKTSDPTLYPLQSEYCLLFQVRWEVDECSTQTSHRSFGTDSHTWPPSLSSLRFCREFCHLEGPFCSQFDFLILRCQLGPAGFEPTFQVHKWRH